jgi:hypothetical protein
MDDVDGGHDQLGVVEETSDPLCAGTAFRRIVQCVGSRRPDEG